MNNIKPNTSQQNINHRSSIAPKPPQPSPKSYIIESNGNCYNNGPQSKTKTIESESSLQSQSEIQQSMPTYRHSPLNRSHSFSYAEHNGSVTSIMVAHSQKIQGMQLEFQSVIRGYQIRLKNIGEEYKRCKHQMQAKIRQLFKQKNYWQNMANNLSQQQRAIQFQAQIHINNQLNNHNLNQQTQNLKQSRDNASQKTNSNPSTSRQPNYPSTSNTQRVLLGEFAKLRKKIQQIEKQNSILNEQKLQKTKQIQKIGLQNNGLRSKVNDFLKQIYKLQQGQSQQQLNNSQIRNKVDSIQKSLKQNSSAKSTSKSKNNSPLKLRNNNPLPTVMITVQEYQHLKMSNQKFKIMISNLNEDMMVNNIKKLNQKYMKNYGSSYSYGSTTNKVNYPATNSSQLQTHIPQTNEHTNLSNFHSSSNYNSSTSLNRSLGDAVKRPASYHNRV